MKKKLNITRKSKGEMKEINDPISMEVPKITRNNPKYIGFLVNVYGPDETTFFALLPGITGVLALPNSVEPHMPKANPSTIRVVPNNVYGNRIIC